VLPLPWILLLLLLLKPPQIDQLLSAHDDINASLAGKGKLSVNNLHHQGRRTGQHWPASTNPPDMFSLSASRPDPFVLVLVLPLPHARAAPRPPPPRLTSCCLLARTSMPPLPVRASCQSMTSLSKQQHWPARRSQQSTPVGWVTLCGSTTTWT